MTGINAESTRMCRGPCEEINGPILSKTMVHCLSSHTNLRQDLLGWTHSAVATIDSARLFRFRCGYSEQISIVLPSKCQ